MSSIDNAYALLTNIQGFDSFSLGPHSSTEEIARAFQTQSLIWHPDKNPGDVQAERIFERMQSAYEVLMDPVTRRAHDERYAAKLKPQTAMGMASSCAVKDRTIDSNASKVEQEPGQPLPEDLGAPPQSARPFAYVDKQPGTATPAHKAGLRRGDAILQLGDATHLRDVQSQLKASVGEPLPVLIIDVQGHFLKKWVVPHAWDKWAPASLLGCQMSDQCPLDLIGVHPAETSMHGRRQNSSSRSNPSLQRRTSSAGRDERHDNIERGDLASESWLSAGRASACLSRALLFLVSLGGLGLGSVIMVYPAFSYGVFNVWKLPSLNCHAVVDFEYFVAYPPSYPPSHTPLRQLHQARAFSAHAIFEARDLEEAHDLRPPAPPRSDTAPPPRSPSPTWTPQMTTGTWSRFQAGQPMPPSPSLPPPRPVSTLSIIEGPPPKSDIIMPAAQQGGSMSTSNLREPVGKFISRAIATDLGVDLIRDAVRYILYASCVMVAISLIGLTLACMRPSKIRAAFTAIYLCVGLPSLVFLVFVSVSSLAFKEDAERLVQKYWHCLASISPTKSSLLPDAYRHVDMAASICIAAAVLLFVGLLTTCRVIGWRVLARHSVMVISVASGLVGAATLMIGLILKITSKQADVFFDGSVMGLGGSTLLVSIVGVAGSKWESQLLLRSYAFALLALLFAVAGVAIYLLVDGTDALSLWLQHHWANMSSHVCSSALKACGGKLQNGVMHMTDSTATVVTQAEIKELAASHLLTITTLIVLLFLVLVVDLLMACVLHYLVTTYGPTAPSEDVEMEPLTPSDEDEDEE